MYYILYILYIYIYIICIYIQEKKAIIFLETVI